MYGTGAVHPGRFPDGGSHDRGGEGASGGYGGVDRRAPSGADRLVLSPLHIPECPARDALAADCTGILQGRVGGAGCGRRTARGTAHALLGARTSGGRPPVVGLSSRGLRARGVAEGTHRHGGRDGRTNEKRLTACRARHLRSRWPRRSTAWAVPDFGGPGRRRSATPDASGTTAARRGPDDPNHVSRGRR